MITAKEARVRQKTLPDIEQWLENLITQAILHGCIGIERNFNYQNKQQMEEVISVAKAYGYKTQVIITNTEKNEGVFKVDNPVIFNDYKLIISWRDEV